MAKIDYARLPELRAIVQRELDGLPKFDYDRRAEFAAALTDVKQRLEKEGATIALDWRGATIKLAGVQSSSTSGVATCLRNWHASAGRSLDKVSALANG